MKLNETCLELAFIYFFILGPGRRWDPRVVGFAGLEAEIQSLRASVPAVKPEHHASSGTINTTIMYQFFSETVTRMRVTL